MNDSDLERFMKLMQKDGGGCWLWNGAKARGYGTFSIRRDGVWRTVRAHRAAYEHFIGDPGTLYVCHKCDTPSCVNPEHLFLGTQQDNANDCKAKGRVYKGGASVPWTRVKTHCKNGHPLSGNNLSKYAKRRVCLACMRSKWVPRTQRKEQSND